MSDSNAKIVIWGSGGISRETAFLIEEINRFADAKRFEILGYIEKDDQNKGQLVSGYPVLGTWEILNELDCDGYVVSMGDPELKRRILEYETAKVGSHLQAFNLIHPSVVMRPGYIRLGVGNIIGAGVVLTTDIEIGSHNLINLNCTIGHDVRIGDRNVINPLASVSGGVRIGSGSLIGAGVSILQNRTIGDRVTIGAGAVVTRDITEAGTYVGVPARALGCEVDS